MSSQKSQSCTKDVSELSRYYVSLEGATYSVEKHEVPMVGKVVPGQNVSLSVDMMSQQDSDSQAGNRYLRAKG
jgi:hypothetical protein